MNARERRIYWNRERNKAARYIAKYRTKFFNALQSDARRFLNAYQESPQAARRFTNDLLTSPQITNTLTQIVREVGVPYARQNFNELRTQKGLGSSLEWIQEIMQYLGLNFYDKGVFRIVQTSRELFVAALNKALEGGWGYYDMARYIETTLTGINRNRAELIARTEVGRAIHSGSFVGAKKSPFAKQKQWIAAKDNRTRGNPFNDRTPQDQAKRNPDHYYLDGVIVDFEDKFTDPRSGSQLEHPHDPEAPANEVINCRCTFAVTNKRDEQGRLVRRQGGIITTPTVNDLPKMPPPQIAPKPIQQPKKPAFVPAKTIKEAEEMLLSKGVRLKASSMKVEHLNKILEAVDKVPAKARPTLITDKAGYEANFGRKIGRKSSEFQGMAQTAEVFDRASFQYKTEKVLVINSREFKTPLDISVKKEKYNEFYASKKNGDKWYLNTFEGSTHYHEMGHLYDNSNVSAKKEWVDLANKWHKESKADMIKVSKGGDFSSENGSEAFAEAFASYYGNDKKNLPRYIIDYLDKILK
jgi:hypothetical protein